MSSKLDIEVQALRAEPVGSLSGIEQGVWGRIASAREARTARAVFVPVRTASVLVALGIGIAGGGFTAAALAHETHEISAFSVNSHLAPSTLLGGHQ